MQSDEEELYTCRAAQNWLLVIQFASCVLTCTYPTASAVFLLFPLSFPPQTPFSLSINTYSTLSSGQSNTVLVLHLEKQREKLHKHCPCQDKCLQVSFPGGQHDKMFWGFFWSNTLCDLSAGER